MAETVLFARTGWMKFYSGSQEGDERPVGGGRYNINKVGSELFNFKTLTNGRLYGFFQPGRKSHAIRLSRVVANISADKCEGVLVIFVAKNAKSRGQRIVGWYRNATLYKETQASDSKERKYSGEHFGFLCETAASDACLLPTARRTFVIPGGEDGFGQSNVCYPLDAKGSPKKTSWMSEAVKYVNSYRDENLLRDAAAEVTPAIEQILEDVIETAAGFEPNPRIRKAIEDYAMRWAKKHFEDEGFAVEDKSKTECYDLVCTKGRERLFVEVKGTRSRGGSVVLTRNEVAHAKANGQISALFVVHSVVVSKAKHPKVTGGKHRVLMPWDLLDDLLRPHAFVFTLPKL